LTDRTTATNAKATATAAATRHNNTATQHDCVFHEEELGYASRHYTSDPEHAVQAPRKHNHCKTSKS
jgi:hypothetical protein